MGDYMGFMIEGLGSRLLQGDYMGLYRGVL